MTHYLDLVHSYSYAPASPSRCVRAACPKPLISFEEWSRNDGVCDACAQLKPSVFYSSRSNDHIQTAAIEKADRMWLAAQVPPVRAKKKGARQ